MPDKWWNWLAFRFLDAGLAIMPEETATVFKLHVVLGHIVEQSHPTAFRLAVATGSLEPLKMAAEHARDRDHRERDRASEEHARIVH